MISPAPSYHDYRFQPDIIAHAVWLYFRFSLSFRDVEDLLASEASRSPMRRSDGGVARSGARMPDCSAPGFLDSGLTVFASTLPRPARRGRVAPGRGFDSRISPASTVRCMSA